MSTISGEIGTVGILNVGHGDTKLSFDPSNPQDVIRAARIVKDMIRRGYALLVQGENGVYRRANDFDESKCEYIIADFDPSGVIDEPDSGEDAGATQPRLGKYPGLKRVPASKARAVAVGPRAGG